MKSLRHGTARHGTARHGTARHGTARHGTGVEIYVHIDKSSSINPADIDSRAKIIQNRVSCEGCGWSCVQATLNSIEEIDKQEPDYSHICLLSGQDYPIKSNEEIFNTIQEGKDYMQYVELPKSNLRFNGWFYATKSLKLTWLFQKFAGFCVKCLHIKRKQLPNMTPYYASAGGTLSRDSIKFVLDFVHNPQNAKTVKGFKRVLVPDEVFYPCVLLNSKRKDNVINNYFRCILANNRFAIKDGMNPGEIEFKPAKKFWFTYRDEAHPEILTIKDYDNIIKCGKLFCRKIDFPQSKELVDKLNEYRNT